MRKEFIFLANETVGDREVPLEKSVTINKALERYHITCAQYKGLVSRVVQVRLS